VRRFIAPAVLALALASRLAGADDPLAPYRIVSIKPSITSVIVATVSMTMPPFVRTRTLYSSTYYARVFPYFFYNERGRIWMTISDDDLRKVASGASIDFKGRALSDAGDERRVEGHATPTGPLTGKIRVKVYVTRRISLNYDTTYELQGVPRPPGALTPRPAR
jgi:hypothetical protein